MWRWLLALAAFAAAPAIAATPSTSPQLEARPIVIGQTWSLPSRVLSGVRTVNVWTPPSYAEQPGRLYPVVYLIDGGLAQDFHHITGLAQLGALSWQTQEMIVVGVETVDRRRELAFPIERDEALRREFPTAGGSAEFRRYLVEEVKPAIEARYRTSGEDALLGESLAGLFILETFLKLPAAFDTYMAMDPSLWWDGGRLAEDAAALLARGAPGRRRLWLSVGSETLAQPAHVDRLVAALRGVPASSLQLRYEPRPSLSHAAIYHPTTYEALQAFYPRPEE